MWILKLKGAKGGGQSTKTCPSPWCHLHPQPFPSHVQVTAGVDDNEVRTFPSFRAKAYGPGGTGPHQGLASPRLTLGTRPLLGSVPPGRAAVRHKQGPGHPAVLQPRSRKQNQIWENPRVVRVSSASSRDHPPLLHLHCSFLPHPHFSLAAPTSFFPHV